MANTEKSRAAAVAALEEYVRVLDGIELPVYGIETALIDLLVDLRHLADSRSGEIDWDEACESAAARYAEELVEVEG